MIVLSFEVISHLHAKKMLPGQPRCSWVELVASGPQKPEILMSHSWGGYFRDFMAVVDKDAGGHFHKYHLSKVS